MWDDARVVAILPEVRARTGLAAMFDTLITLPQDASTVTVYGEDGYRIDASTAPQDSVVHINNARMTLTLGHQSLSFRSFPMEAGPSPCGSSRRRRSAHLLAHESRARRTRRLGRG